MKLVHWFEKSPVDAACKRAKVGTPRSSAITEVTCRDCLIAARRYIWARLGKELPHA